ncbi:YrhK family protein [Paeniglutamicibacter antarcticus]|uniref:YrhK family protein n=1 Tax=Arthrobacter terrae TaxID=2935737 RepID=A0A931CKY2_9MICC|nr:YrhK family protein [Arthrobacter terrae]
MRTVAIALWCFLSGSVCFVLKPTLRLVRQLENSRRPTCGPDARCPPGIGARRRR